MLGVRGFAEARTLMMNHNVGIRRFAMPLVITRMDNGSFQVRSMALRIILTQFLISLYNRFLLGNNGVGQFDGTPKPGDSYEVTPRSGLL